MANLDPGPVMLHDSIYGFEYGETTPERMTATCPVTEKVLQPYGIVHGGIFCSMAETIASTFAGSRPSEKLGTHSINLFMGYFSALQTTTPITL